ncbi:MAG: hypothetical protein GY898_06565 [Proteobacteria bacterium]|nr:hypothetical protein [Pseudomonadota bacterium]
MVITCPSCSARYRLNPDKIEGRGAKITCPKCSHIFVVFSEQEEKSSPGAEVPEAPMPKGPNTAGDALATRDRATTTGAFKAVGIDEGVSDPALTASGKIRVVAPGPRKARRRSATTFDSSASLEAIRSASVSTVAPPAPEVESPAVSSPGVVAADIPEPASASELDFREVGITTWKVKVAIGLIYDFSDISTLKKYLADKKVTEDDLISHNAKDWVRIGDIENLDRHFIETWKIAKADKIARGSSTKVKKPAADDAAASGRFSAAGSSATAGSTGSFAGHGPAGGGLAGSGQARARSPRKAKAPEPPAPRSKAPLALVAVVLLGVVGYFVFGRPSPVPTTANNTAGTTTAAAPDADIGDAEREAIRERIRRDMEEQRRQLEAQELAEDLTPEERVLEPVTPNRVPERQQPGRLPSPIREIPFANRPSDSATAGNSGGGSAEVKVSDTDSGGKMYYGKAKETFAAGNYGVAKSMIKKAIQKDPNNGSYYALQGDIYTALGEPEAAAIAYNKAESMGTTVNRAGP